MPSFDTNGRFEDQNQGVDSASLSGEASAKTDESLVAEQDLLMEQILDNINTTPIGQVLKKIASLPEVRREKVLDVRQQLIKGKYKLNERLNTVLDKVLEDLTT
ncbi:MAG: hypothetical protein WAK60_00615 [Sedimentisphaerales bacterium]